MASDADTHGFVVVDASPSTKKSDNNDDGSSNNNSSSSNNNNNSNNSSSSSSSSSDMSSATAANESSSSVSKKKRSRSSESIQHKLRPGELEGVTYAGQRFVVPVTREPFHFDVARWHLFDWLRAAGGLLFVAVPLLPGWFFVAMFVFWRLMYDVFLGYLLHRQSNDYMVTEWYTRAMRTPDSLVARAIRFYLRTTMGASYVVDEQPPAFNSWLVFRGVVDVILGYDVVAYAAFCFKYWQWPAAGDVTLSLLVQYVVGIALFAFTGWAKRDAYRVVKDFAWYWGDFFFLIEQELTFDRVFAMFPHPMYTLGYSFFYGASLLTQSPTVFYVSLFGHFCQLMFLTFSENPHIDKTYGSMVTEPAADERQRAVLYDADKGYFRRDLIVFRNLDLFRSSDVFMLVIIAYVVVLHLADVTFGFYVAHALVWRLVSSFGLGYVLLRQSRERWWTEHFTRLGQRKQDAFESWKSLFNMTTVLVVLSFVSLALKARETPFSPLSMIADMLAGGVAARSVVLEVIGFVLIGVNLWSSFSVYEVLGEFGWFYSDFFIDEVPSKLYYQGIYRFFNNPDLVTGFAGLYGLALISHSWLVFGLALFSQSAYAMFTHFVEQPHMRKLYGDTVRERAGFEIAVKDILDDLATKNAKVAELQRRYRDLRSELRQHAGKVVDTLKPKST